MKRKGGSNPRGQRPPQQRGGQGGGGRPSFGSRGGSGHSSRGAGHSGHSGHAGHSGRGRPGGRPTHRGPKSCPMCGAVVADLKAHIRDRHDDAEAHPR